MRLRHSKRDCGDLIVKAVVWNIWLTRNDCIFYVNVLLAFYIILKIDHVLLFWFSLVSDGLKQKFAEPISSIRRSWSFLDLALRSPLWHQRTRRLRAEPRGRSIFSGVLGLEEVHCSFVCFHFSSLLFDIVPLLVYSSLCQFVVALVLRSFLESCTLLLPLIEVIYSPFQKKNLHLSIKKSYQSYGFYYDFFPPFIRHTFTIGDPPLLLMCYRSYSTSSFL